MRISLTSLLYCSGNKKKTKNLQNASKPDELNANQAPDVEDLEEQAKSTKKKRASDRPSRADAQVSTKGTLLKLHVLVNYFQFRPSLWGLCRFVTLTLLDVEPCVLVVEFSCYEHVLDT